MTIEIEVSPDQEKQLHEIAHGYDPHQVRDRAHAILLVSQGNKSPEEVADIFFVSRVTIYNWIHRWIRCGIDGLYDLAGRGRKPIFSRSEEEVILSEIRTEPKSLRHVAAQMEKLTGKKAHVETFRRIAIRNGKCWKRMRKTPKGEPDATAYEQGKADIKELRLLESQGEFDIAYLDEAGISLEPYVPYAWQDIGRDGTLKIQSSRSKRINLLGILKPLKNTLDAWRIQGHIDSETIVEIMDEYSQTIDTPTVVILDHASFHTSAMVKNRAAEWEKRGLSFYLLPTYSPELNLIEILWRIMKYHWIPSSAYRSLSELRKAVDRVFDGFGSDYKINFSLV
jgi:transposase